MFERNSFLKLDPLGVPYDYGVQSIVAGANITVDNTDPLRPIISSTGGSQTPWTSDIDAAGFALNNLNGMSFSDGAVFAGGEEWDNSSLSWIVIAADGRFGIHNGEAGGSGGENINLVSDNGHVLVQPMLAINTTTPKRGFHLYNYNLGDSFDPLGKVLIESTSQNNAQLQIVDQTSSTAGVQMCGEATINSDGTTSPVDTTNQWFFGAGFGLGTMKKFVIYNGSFGYEMVMDSTGHTFFGGQTGDDGSAVSLQSASGISTAGSYWAQGSQGITITDAAGTFVGGIRTA